MYILTYGGEPGLEPANHHFTLVANVTVFILIYIIAAVLLIPCSVLKLGAGAVFGFLKGLAIVSFASTTAAIVAFLISRYLVRNALAQRLTGNKKLAALDSAVAKEGWKIVILARLAPVFPITLLNYAFGFTRVKLGDYILASWVGMTPGSAIYVYLGSVANADGNPYPRTPTKLALYGMGLAASFLATLFVTLIIRRTLSGKTHN